MARIGKLTVGVELSVSDETAARCIALLNMYLDANDDLHLVRKADGDRLEWAIEQKPTFNDIVLGGDGR